MSDVLAVVTLWKRPENTGAIVRALASQTVRPRIVVVDNAGFGRANRIAVPADDWWVIEKNYGPPCRFAPVFMELDAKYTLLIDDDLLPGKRAVEYLIGQAAALEDRFSTLGTVGRRYRGTEYVRRNIRKLPGARLPIDMTARAHFFRTPHIEHVRRAWNWIMRTESDSLARIHDDIFICQSIQAGTGYPSFLVPGYSDAEQSLRKVDLPDGGGGVSSQPDFLTQRNDLIDWFQNSYGWRSLT